MLSSKIMLIISGSKHPSSFIGCSVWMTATQTYSANDTVEYDGIALNIGNHFNLTSNQFVCYTDAVYYVTATAKKSGTSDLQVRIELISK